MLKYVQLSARLNVVEKEKLLEEQRIWLVDRDAKATRAGNDEAGGSVAPATYSQTYIELTKKRFQVLSDRLKTQ